MRSTLKRTTASRTVRPLVGLGDGRRRGRTRAAAAVDAVGRPVWESRRTAGLLAAVSEIAWESEEGVRKASWVSAVTRSEKGRHRR